MKIFSVIFIKVLVFLGCTSSHLINYQQSSYTELNKKLEGKKGLIKLADGQTLKCKHIVVGHDSTSWIESRYNVKQKVATSEVREIHIKNHCRGTKDGLLSGLKYGAFLGAAFGVYVMAQDDSGGMGNDDDWLWIPIMGGGTGVLFGLTGAVVGGASGSTENYVLNAPDSTSININGE